MMMNYLDIEKVIGREILDSRGKSYLPGQFMAMGIYHGYGIYII